MVALDGTYISLLDLLLLASARDKELVCLLFDDREKVECRSLRHILEEIKNVKIEDMKESPDLSSPNTWIIIGCKANFERGSVIHLNHFLPGWHKAQLGKDRQLSLLGSMKEIMVREAKLVREAADLDVQEKDGKLDSLMLETLRNDLEMRKADLQREDTTKKVIQELSIVCKDVPGDGNCGLWTILALQNNDIPKNCFFTAQQKDVKSLREESCLALGSHSTALNSFKLDQIGFIWIYIYIYI